MPDDFANIGFDRLSAWQGLPRRKNRLINTKERKSKSPVGIGTPRKSKARKLLSTLARSYQE